MVASSYYIYSKCSCPGCRAGVFWQRRQDGHLRSDGAGVCAESVGFDARLAELGHLFFKPALMPPSGFEHIHPIRDDAVRPQSQQALNFGVIIDGVAQGLKAYAFGLGHTC